ncbi:MAG TPA: chorismate-binding protein [bacterium]
MLTERNSTSPFNPVNLRSFYRAAIACRLSVAVWRLPHDPQSQAIIDFSGRCEPQPVGLLAGGRGGFMVAPFMNRGGNISYFLPAHGWLRGDQLNYTSDLFSESAVVENKSGFEATLRGLLSSGNGHDEPARWHVCTLPATGLAVGKDNFIRMVDDAVSHIERHDFRKVVLSRIIERDLPPDFDPIGLFHRLCDAFPGAFVSLVAMPGIGTWIGATPELHMTIKDNQLRTVALAGTMTAADLDAKWGTKELEEQAIVSEYIRGCFQRHDITNVAEHGPETVRVGDLLHLQTTFTADFKKRQNLEAVNRLLLELHPTPAVCGLPKEVAMQYILRTESHDRQFYSGFLGPVNYSGQSNLFVNLRCLQLLPTSAILYAGVGITKDSVPENEWRETQLKFNALLKFLDSADDRKPLRFSPTRELMEDL